MVSHVYNQVNVVFLEILRRIIILLLCGEERRVLTNNSVAVVRRYGFSLPLVVVVSLNF